MCRTYRSRHCDDPRPSGLAKSLRRAFVVILAAMPLMAASRPVEISPAPPPLDQPVLGRFDYAGLIHVHTGHSDDARGDYAGRARAAAGHGIRFIVITDHNTLGPGVARGDAWRDGVLMLTGLESSRPEGHLLAVGMETAPLSPETPTDAFLASVTGQGGLAVLAHPTHRKWAWEGPIDDRIGAMEILDLADQFAASSATDKITALAGLPVTGPRAYLTMATRPDTALALWDTIGQRRRMVGLYAPDIHEAIEVSDDNKIPFPPAGDIMRLARDHVLTSRPLSGDVMSDRAVLLDAIGQGRVYVSLDILGDGRGFDFAALSGSARVEMGAETQVGGPRRFEVTLPRHARRLQASIRLLRNGQVVSTSAPSATSLSYSDARPGVYRVEVLVPAEVVRTSSKDVVWIYSNPVYVRSGPNPSRAH
ncbi:hypothetical protein BH09PSE1_BH09PSE1_30530 [soil metagenome]